MDCRRRGRSELWLIPRARHRRPAPCSFEVLVQVTRSNLPLESPTIQEATAGVLANQLVKPVSM
jgi:hypothetical protein